MKVDGHAIVTRHLAILAMTGSGKTWASRRIIEELAQRGYPIVIFDPRGDYTKLGEADGMQGKVVRYFAQFPLFEEDADTVAQIVNSLGYPMTETMLGRFGEVFGAASSFIVDDEAEMSQRVSWLAQRTGDAQLEKYGVKPDMWLIGKLAHAAEAAMRDEANGAADRQQLLDWGVEWHQRVLEDGRPNVGGDQEARDEGGERAAADGADQPEDRRPQRPRAAD